MTVYHRIGAELRTLGESGIVLVELSFEDSQPVELREQKTRSLADGTDRIVGMLRFPRGKILLRSRKIQVVEPQESAVQSRDWNGIGSRRGSCPRTPRQA